MRVFNCQYKIESAGGKTLQSINCSLTSDDLQVIVTGISLIKKTDNEVLESVKKNLYETINELKS